MADTTAPTIQQPADLVVAATGPGSTNVMFTVDATDPDDAESAVSVHCEFGGGAGKTFPAGTTTETLS